MLPRGGAQFRKWFARKVVVLARDMQLQETRVFYQRHVNPSVAHYERMMALRLDISTSVACYNHKQNYRLDQHLKRNVWFNYWGWHERCDYKSKKRL